MNKNTVFLQKYSYIINSLLTFNVSIYLTGTNVLYLPVIFDLFLDRIKCIEKRVEFV